MRGKGEWGRREHPRRDPDPRLPAELRALGRALDGEGWSGERGGPAGLVEPAGPPGSEPWSTSGWPASEWGSGSGSGPESGSGSGPESGSGSGSGQSMAERVLAQILAEGMPAPTEDPARSPEPGRFERARAWARNRLDWFEGCGGADTDGIDVRYTPAPHAHPARRSTRFLPARRGRR